MQFWPAFSHCVSLCEDFDFALFATIGTVFVDVGIHIILQLQTFTIENIGL